MRLRHTVGLLVALAMTLLARPARAQFFSELPVFSLNAPVGVPADSTASPIGPQAFTLADVNHDNILDLVIISQTNHSVDVYLGNGAGGNGDGTFAMIPNSYEVFPGDPPTAPGDLPTAVAVADVSSSLAASTAGAPDGNPDIIVGSDAGGVWILPGNGDGTFAPHDQDLADLDALSAATGIIGLAIGKFDGDDTLDIAVADDGDSVYFACNNNGIFGSCTTDMIDATGDSAVDIVAGDFDGDGHLDVATLNDESPNPPDVSLIYGDGTGQFSEVSNTINVSAGEPDAQPVDLAVGLINDDNISDLMALSSGGFGAQYLVAVLGRSGQRFSTFDVDTPFNSTALALADFNGDTVLDAFETNEAAANAGIQLGNGDGTFGASNAPAGVRNGLEAAVGIASGQLGGDDLADFIILLADGQRMAVGINQTRTHPTNTPAPTRTPTLTETPTPTITGTIPSTPTASPTVPTRTATATRTPTPIPTANYGRCNLQVNGQLAGIATGLLDGDGSVDIAVTDAANNAVYVIANTAQLQTQLRTCAMSMSTLSVTPSQTIPVGPSPGAIVASDIDRDGDVDLIVAESDGIVVLRNDGKGNFTPEAPIAVGAQPVAIIADYPIDPQNPSVRAPLDLNRDGHTDLVVANRGSTYLSILYGTPSGTFTSPPSTLGVPGNPATVTAADFDQDGNVDLVAGVGTQIVLLQQSSLNADHQAVFALSRIDDVGETIVNVASGYFNTDMVPDLLVTFGGEADVYLYQNGAFGKAGTFGAGAGSQGSTAGPTAAGIGRFNSIDSNSDAVVANFQDSALYFGISDGKGTGSFRLPAIIPFGLGGQPMALSVASIDSDYDGIPDIVTANQNGTITAVLSSVPPPTPTPLPTNTPTGTFTVTPTSSPTATPSVTPSASPTPNGTLTVTPTGSPTPTPLNTVSPTPTKAGAFVLGGGCSIDATPGRPSLGAAAVLALLLFVRPARGRRARGLLGLLLAGWIAAAGTASAQTLPSYVTCQVLSGTLMSASLLGGAVGDFDSSGSPDLALVDNNPAGNQIIIAATNPDDFKRGSCPEGITVTTHSPAAGALAVAMGNLNADSFPDLAVLQTPPPQVQVFTNDGHGMFMGESTSALPLAPGSQNPAAVLVSDLDGDRQNDLIASDGTSGVALQFGSKTPPTPPVATPTPLPLGGKQVQAVGVADFDDNTLLDIAAVDVNGNVYLFLQTAARTFTAQTSFPLGEGVFPRDMQVANPQDPNSRRAFDFDNNGTPDLAFITFDGMLRVFLRDANTVSFHEFQPPVMTGGNPTALALSDLNGDGKLDAVVADHAASKVYFFLGDGTGKLTPFGSMPTSAPPNAILLADLDDDGLDDIITTNSDGSLTIFLSGNPPPTPTPTSTPLPPPSSSPTETGTPTPTATPTATPTWTPTSTPTGTPSATITPTASTTATITETTTPGQFEIQGQGCANVGGGSGPADAMPLLVFAALVFLRRRAR